MFKLALAQMHVEGGDKERNLCRAEAMIAEAANSGAACVVVPEAMNLGWAHPSNRTLADAIPLGESCKRLSAAASENRVHVCSGLVEQADGQVFNSAVLIDSNGDVILTHRKLNELDIGHEFYSHGDRLNACKTAFGTVGIMICADAFAKGEAISRALGCMGADIILSPCAWAVPADYDHETEPYGQLCRFCGKTFVTADGGNPPMVPERVVPLSNLPEGNQELVRRVATHVDFRRSHWPGARIRGGCPRGSCMYWCLSPHTWRSVTHGQIF